MNDLIDIINYKKQENRKPQDSELRKLPFKHAFIRGRVSYPVQIRYSQESIREIARLVDLAKQDGYESTLDSLDIEKKLA